MNTFVPARTTAGAETVRLSDDDLHRAARKALSEGNHAVFGMLPSLVNQLIEHKVWETRTKKFKNFGEYALSQTSAGLSIDNNQQLWMLRCALDAHGKHIKEWAEVLEEVERSVRVWADEEGKTIRSFGGNSLEALGKASSGSTTDKKITYLPSGTGSTDARLMRLRKNDPKTYQKVISGEMTVPAYNLDLVYRAMSYIRRMNKADRKQLIARMTEEGLI